MPLEEVSRTRLRGTVVGWGPEHVLPDALAYDGACGDV